MGTLDALAATILLLYFPHFGKKQKEVYDFILLSVYPSLCVPSNFLGFWDLWDHLAVSLFLGGGFLRGSCRIRIVDDYFFPELLIFILWRSGVGIVTGYGLDDRGVGVRVPVGSRIFSSPSRPDRLWGPLSLLSNGYRALSPGVKR
jgi:hypothetical protein